MPNHYIQVESVNLANVVYDTNDISTIRGGSYMLFSAVEHLKDEFKTQLVEITTAASQGLFLWDGDPEQQDIEQKILSFLSAQTKGLATFIVAIEPDIPNQFPLVLERLRAQVRRKQWRMPTIAIPDYDETAQECFLDGWRPGVESYRVDPQVTDAKISKATAYRRQEGRRLKHALFYKLLGDSDFKNDLCAKDLGDLSNDANKGILNGKIAFIHIDGNNFGAIRGQRCTEPKIRQDFDQLIQEKFRNPYLQSLVEWAKSDPDFSIKDASGNLALRLEVLLWGGDEMTLVVPAWKGLSVLQHFFKQAQTLTFETIPLTHRAAIIFCHNNAPILLIRTLAEELLYQTKEDIKANSNGASPLDHQTGDAAHYLVLESFDTLRGELSDFLGQYYRGADYKDLLLYGNDLQQLLNTLHLLSRIASKGRVLDIVKALQAGNLAHVHELRGQLLASIPPNAKADAQSAINTLTQHSIARWYLLSDLWDYVLEQE